MQRSKQQAMMFLLGALLVGGVLGFSAERVFRHDSDRNGSWSWRDGMYDDLDLSLEQRAQIDSVLDQRNCQMRALMDGVRPQADSIREAGQEQMLRVMTDLQRARFDARRAEIEAKHEVERAARGPKRPTETCK